VGNNHNEQLVPSQDIVRKFLEEALDHRDQYDQEVIDLVKKHFAQASLHSKAGARLASELIALANVRAKKDSQ